MSPLWRDRLLVSFTPTAVSWVRMAGAFRARVAAKGSVAVASDDGAEPWRGAISVLQREAEHWRAERLDITIVLSNYFVRYAIVPAPQNRIPRAEAIALARFHFGRIHGERAAAWHVSVTPAPPKHPAVASAVDTALLETLKSSFPRGGKLRLVSVQPYTMSVFNRARDRITHQGAWLLVVEPGTACLGMLIGREWSSLQTVRSGYANPANWPALLDREKHRAATAQVPTTVFVRSTVPAPQLRGDRDGWHFVTLDVPAPRGDLMEDELGTYEMALQAA